MEERKDHIGALTPRPPARARAGGGLEAPVFSVDNQDGSAKSRGDKGSIADSHKEPDCKTILSFFLVAIPALAM